MITFKLDDNSAQAMVSVLNAVHPDATFVQDITAQYVKATAVVVEEVPAELIKVIEEPLVNKKTKAVAPVEGDK